MANVDLPCASLLFSCNDSYSDLQYESQAKKHCLDNYVKNYTDMLVATFVDVCNVFVTNIIKQHPLRLSKTWGSARK